MGHHFYQRHCTILFFSILLSTFNFVHGYMTCKFGTGGFNVREVIFRFGKPAVFVTANSEKFNSYSLIDKQRTTSIIEEYLMVGYNNSDKVNKRIYEDIKLVLYDGTESIQSHDDVEQPDLVNQNLVKEYYWGVFNSTGMYPSMTIFNMTMKRYEKFSPAQDPKTNDTDKVSLLARITEKDLFREPQIPLEAVFEIPANSRVLQGSKVVIQFNSFTLWRWRLSDTIVSWDDIVATFPTTEPANPKFNPNLGRIDNPCTKDMFLAYVHREDKANPQKKFFYLSSPLIQSQFEEHWFYDMTSSKQPWFLESVQKVILTNDHLVVLTNEALWISHSLNHTEVNYIESNYTDRKPLEYKRVDPCDKRADNILCFSNAAVSQSKDEGQDLSCDPDVVGYATGGIKQQLFYNPVCYLNQYPNYDDYLIMAVDDTDPNIHNSKGGFSVLYSARPYTQWRLLFTNFFYYLKTKKKEQWTVKGIVGVFFNNHLRQFDITVKLCGPKTSKTPQIRFTRFVVPEPVDFIDGYGEDIEDSNGAIGRQLSDVMGNGFLDFTFPATFTVANVVVNGDTMDVFFLGNQLWIAEAGGPFVYASLTGLSKVDDKDALCTGSLSGPGNSKIQECSFNHPDRSYICMNEDRRLMLVGRIGSAYSPIVVEIDTIPELALAQRVHGWPRQHFCDLIQQKSVLIVGFSGTILVWYIHEPEVLKSQQTEAIQNYTGPREPNNCASESPERVICKQLAMWKGRSCTAMADGKSRYQMLPINPVKLSPRQRTTDGPLVPFFVDSISAILFEAIVPPYKTEFYVYFSEVNIGQKIYCKNYDLLSHDRNDRYKQYNCELFMRHIKPVDEYLDGFRRCLFVTIIKSIPLLAVPADVVVLVHPRSNSALVKIDDHLNDPPWKFTKEHIGQTLYLPGNFSILLAGFPKQDSSGNPDYSFMNGYTTMYVQYEKRIVYHAFFSYLIDMSTKKYREVQVNLEDETVKREKARLGKIDKENQAKRDMTLKMREDIQKLFEQSPFSDNGQQGTQEGKFKLFRHNYSAQVVPHDVEEAKLLTIADDERHQELCKVKNPHCQEVVVPASWEKVPPPPDSELSLGKYVPYDDRSIWYVAEGECNYILKLSRHPVLESHGGRISLDLHDSLSLEVRLQSLTTLGKIMMHRPLLVVTNSNPNVLRVERSEKLQGEPQEIQMILSPTGYRTGTAVVTIRSVVGSLKCRTSTSISFIVLVMRDFGRRLHVNYPIALCKPRPDSGRYPRPWVVDQPGCVHPIEILNSSNTEIVRYHFGRKHTAFITLPTNYRPPSVRGTDIPMTKNVYNADPSKPHYKAWYKASRDAIELIQCKGKETKKECTCTNNDRLSDDEHFSECKEKVFFSHRTGTGHPIPMSISYDRVMRDKDQHPEFFTAKLNWSVHLEEINGRTEWYIQTEESPYLDLINSNPMLNEGKPHYNMREINVTLLGTGLYHFKASLGRFESFSDVTGYFMVYANPNELNDIHMFLIILITIVFCFSMVFLGFLVSRKRLSSMLPIQPMAHKKKLKLL